MIRVRGEKTVRGRGRTFIDPTAGKLAAKKLNYTVQEDEEFCSLKQRLGDSVTPFTSHMTQALIFFILYFLFYY